MFLTLLLLTAQPLLSFPADSFPATFQAQTIDPEAGRVVYAVTVADVDGDGDQDIVATESSVIWYQQPGWRKRVILRDQTPPDNVCIAA